jgi:anti-sigma factor RsiW
MSETFRCEDKETLVAYLYGEVDADQRREVERHLRACAACASESDGLQAVRRDLESWLPPEAELGFSMVQKPATVLRPLRWAAAGAMPAWAQVAAAVLVLAAGAAIANIQVRYDNQGLTIATGWMAPQPAPQTTAVSPAPAAAVVTTTPNDDWRPALVALEQNLRDELAQIKRAAAQPAAVRTADRVAAADVERIVKTMIDASEQRQRQELALRLTQSRRELDMQRRGDLMNINQLYGVLQARTFATQAGQQETMNLIRSRVPQQNR